MSPTKERLFASVPIGVATFFAGIVLADPVTSMLSVLPGWLHGLLISLVVAAVAVGFWLTIAEKRVVAWSSYAGCAVSSALIFGYAAVERGARDELKVQLVETARCPPYFSVERRADDDMELVSDSLLLVKVVPMWLSNMEQTMREIGLSPDAYVELNKLPFEDQRKAQRCERHA